MAAVLLGEAFADVVIFEKECNCRR